MDPTKVGGLIQLITGLLALAFQGYTMFHGAPVDVSHVAVGSGLAFGGVAHLTNGRH